MRITFRRFPRQASAQVVIERDDGVVYRMQEHGQPGGRLPRDLRRLVVERELGLTDGLWGRIADGAVYQRMEPVRGRRPAAAEPEQEPVTPAGELTRLVEAIAMLDAPSEEDIRRLTRTAALEAPVAGPAALARAARALQVEAARWARLRAGEELVYSWPATPAAPVSTTRALRAVPGPRDAGHHRHPRRTGRPGPALGHPVPSVP